MRKIEDRINKYLISEEEHLSEEDIAWFDDLWAGKFDDETLDEMSFKAAAGYVAAAAGGTVISLMNPAGGAIAVGTMYLIRKQLANCSKGCEGASGDEKQDCVDHCRATAKSRRRAAKVKAKRDKQRAKRDKKAAKKAAKKK